MIVQPQNMEMVLEQGLLESSVALLGKGGKIPIPLLGNIIEALSIAFPYAKDKNLCKRIIEALR